MEAYLEPAIALVALTTMEVVLGIDNVVFLAVLTGRLPEHQRAKARQVGLLLAMGMRVALLFMISIILKLDEPIFHLSTLGIPQTLTPAEVDAISIRDLILLAGGLFLVGKSVLEIHKKIENHDGEAHHAKAAASMAGVLVQVAIIDLIFSLDSVITAVGMVRPEYFWLMVTSIVVAILFMMVFAGTISRFVEKHPTLKILALSFLILIGVMLIAEGAGTHINKGYIYFAMAFALIVEVLNLQIRQHTASPHSVAAKSATLAAGKGTPADSLEQSHTEGASETVSE